MSPRTRGTRVPGETRVRRATDSTCLRCDEAVVVVAVEEQRRPLVADVIRPLGAHPPASSAQLPVHHRLGVFAASDCESSLWLYGGARQSWGHGWGGDINSER